MSEQGAFYAGIEFLDQLGVFEIVLPFFLVFTLMFAYLEKTKVFGTETYRSGDDGSEYELPRKNLNSVVALTIAFFVVASTQLVKIISEIASSAVLVLLLGFAFTLVVGAFQKEEDEGFYLDETWTFIFQWISFLAIGLIFLNALGWLEPIISYAQTNLTGEVATTIFMLVALLGVMGYVVYTPKPGSSDGE